MENLTLDGHGGKLTGYRWNNDNPRYIAILVHGYGEHMGRYEQTAADFVADGAVVYGIDHIGHGQSEGERVAFTSFDSVVGDLHLLVVQAQAEHPDLPVAMIGHSMGGMLAVRYGQLFADNLKVMVLSAPVLGMWRPLETFDPDAEPAPIPLDSLSRIEEIQQAYDQDPLVWHGGMKQVMVDSLQQGLRDINATGELSVPTLWLHGSDDSLVHYDETRYGWEKIEPETGEQSVLPGSRHEIYNDLDRDEAIAQSLSFIHRYL